MLHLGLKQSSKIGRSALGLLAGIALASGCSSSERSATSVVWSANEATLYGDPVLLYATVLTGGSSRVPTGTITFKDGEGAAVGTPVPLQTVFDAYGAVLELDGAPVGPTVRFTAVYSGDGDFSGSTSNPLSVVVVAVPTDISMAVEQDGASGLVTLSAIINSAGATPLGGVSFFCDGVLISGPNSGTNPMLAGVTATLSSRPPDIPVGTHNFTASFAGAPDFEPSTSATDQFTVQ
jgi:hypothetical protein